MFYVVKTILNITVTCVSETEITSASLADWLGGWIVDPSNSQYLWVQIPVEAKDSTNNLCTILKYVHKYLKYSANLIGPVSRANDRIAPPTRNKMAPICANYAQTALNVR